MIPAPFTRWEAPMRSPTQVLVLLPLALAWSQQSSKPAPHASSPAYQPIPVAAARQPNPVKPTPESIEAGKKIYSYDCVMCHGALGDGKTGPAKEMKIPNFTDPAVLKDHPDGELFYVIKNGRGDMPLEGDRVKPEQIWDLVNYVRSLAAKKPPTEPKSPETKPPN
jgi:mono/diheme cytochrome c family protein